MYRVISNKFPCNILTSCTVWPGNRGPDVLTLNMNGYEVEISELFVAETNRRVALIDVIEESARLATIRIATTATSLSFLIAAEEIAIEGLLLKLAVRTGGEARGLISGHFTVQADLKSSFSNSVADESIALEQLVIR